MNYDAKRTLRGNILDEVFEQSNPIDEFARTQWQLANRLPSEEENKAACDKLCKIAQTVAKPAFIDREDLYKVFCKECEEITARFQKLEAKTPIEAACGVSQVAFYLYDECFDLTAKALEIFAPRKEEWE